MNEYIVMMHNRVVQPNDRVYFLGDVAFHKRDLSILNRMNGRKVLIKGNHDTLELKEYTPYFDDVRGCHQVAGLFMGHVPIHPDSLGRWGAMAHGHLHANVVTYTGNKVPDPKYYSVCMEQLDDYKHVSLEEIKKNLLARGVEI
jgi:calcineurin-like phosphoesterase family protein